MPDAARTESDSPPNPTAAGQPAGSSFLTPDLWRGLRWAAVGGYLVILLTWILVVGIPLDRIGLTLWILFGLAATCVGKGWRHFGRVLLDWLPFTGILIVYDYTRGLADTLGMPVHVMDAVHADMWLFGGTLPTVWLQEHFYDPSTVHWYDVVATIVYVSHFVVFPLVAAVLWLRNRARFRAWIYRVLALAVIGVSTYILYPLSPPWLTSEWGLIPEIDRISSRGWGELGLSSAGQVLSDGQALSNPVAAMPSLHAAYAALVALFFCASVRWWVRPILLLYPLAMGLTLVYSGEHYVIDALFGYLAAAVITLSAPLLRRLRERWRRRRAERRAETGSAGEPTEAAVDGVPAAGSEPRRAHAPVGEATSIPGDSTAAEAAEATDPEPAAELAGASREAPGREPPPAP